MQQIIFKLPDEFSAEEIESLKISVLDLIELKLKSELKIPQEEIDAVDEQVNFYRDQNANIIVN